jgi:hypothetical protein
VHGDEAVLGAELVQAFAAEIVVVLHFDPIRIDVRLIPRARHTIVSMFGIADVSTRNPRYEFPRRP